MFRFLPLALLVSLAFAGEALTPERCNALAAELETHLQQHILKPWFPAAVDPAGGFLQDFSEDWTNTPGGNKTIVYQSRLTWMAAAVALAYPERAAEFLPHARHGMDFLAAKMWDAKNGGFSWAVDTNGKPLPDEGGEKHVYGISFGLYAASVCFKATKDPRDLELARKAFGWLEEHAFDKQHHGYFEALSPAGVPILLPHDQEQNDRIGTRYGFKSMNTHIHLLESLTALFEVWPDPLLRTRLEQLYGIVSERIAVHPGCLHLYFNPDWTPVPDLDSFGHDVETAYLLVEASAALSHPDSLAAWESARGIVGHALQFGWDTEHGGFYDEGGTFRKVWVTDKVWWVQAEGLNALLLLHEKCGAHDPRFGAAFLQQWEFIRDHQVDRVHGGWISHVAPDGKAEPGQAKSDQWKDPYHQGRALLNVIARLKQMALKK